MARQPTNSVQPAMTTPEVSLRLDATVLSIVAGLDGYDLDGLRRQWRAHLGGEPPAHLPRAIDENVGLSTAGRCLGRSRQVSSADALPGERRQGCGRVRPARASNARWRRPERRRAAGARVEWQA